jgi:two-component system NtrC family sensor kinase
MRRGAGTVSRTVKKLSRKGATPRRAPKTTRRTTLSSRRELNEALQREAATAEILRIISSAPSDTQVVFDAIVSSGLKLFPQALISIALSDGHEISVAAIAEADSARAEAWRQRFPFPLSRNYMHGIVILDAKPVDIPDVAEASAELAPGAHNFLASGYRAITIMPMMRGEAAVGALTVVRLAPGPLTDEQLALLQTFARQAVIAIENARLLNELRQRTDDLSKSLEDLRTTQDHLVQTEKLASLGQLTAGIGHEIKNPLNFVNNFSAVSVELIDELRQGLTGPLDDKLRAQISEIADMLQGNLDKVVQHGKRADAIVKNMLLHSRQGSAEHRPVDINALVEESLNLAYHGARAEQQGFNITLERSLDPAAGEVDIFPQDITRVLLNLISNGFYAATKRKGQADGGGYEPTLMAATRNLGESVEIRIRDNGTGVPPEVKEQMFNPFYTTKPAGEGTGLGLSISHDIIVKQHGGSIEVDTTPGEFTEIKITLPRSGVFLAELTAHA